MSERPPERGGLFGITTRRPVAVFMAFVTLFTFGWESLQRLPMNLLPDISYPRVTVRAEYPGAAPEDVEDRVSKRLHEALSVLPDLESISSISRAGVSDVTLEFRWGTQLTFAIQDIRERLDRTMLPLEVESPIILRYDPTLDPIMTLGLTGGRDLIELRRLAEDRLAPALSTVEGVAAVRVRGGLEDEIQVRLMGDRLANFGLTAEDVASRLAAENVNLASGTVLEGDTEYLVRILNEYRDAEEIGRTIVFRDADRLVRLSELATVHRTHKERDVITRINGRESVELQIFKEADANIVEMARGVRDHMLGSAAQRATIAELRRAETPDPRRAFDELQAEIRQDEALAAALAAMTVGQDWGRGGRRGRGGDGDQRNQGDEDAEESTDDDEVDTEEAELDPEAEAAKTRATEVLAEINKLREQMRLRDEAYDYLAADLPADVHVHLLTDQSTFIESALDEVKNSGLLGAVMAVVVLFLFLQRLGTTLIIAAAIPVSVVVTFVPLHLTDTSLNVMSLGGLALGIGMVVDNAIVVLESIARFREQGQGLADAAVNGVREVAGAATASTLTTVAVFAPIVFVEGIAGQIFRDQALTVVASLLVSLLVALFLVPMLASRYGLGRVSREDLSAAAARLRVRLLSAFGWRMRFTWPRKPRRYFVKPLLMLCSILAWPLQALYWMLKMTTEALGRLVVLISALGTWFVLAVLGTTAVTFRVLMYVPGKIFEAVYGVIQRAYPPFINAIISKPGNAGLTLAVSGLLLGWTLTTAGSLGSELLPEVHQGQIIGRLTMPVGTPLEDTDLIAQLGVQSLKDHPDVAWTASTVGVARDEIAEPDEGEHTARLIVGLNAVEDMPAAEERVIDTLRAELGERPELRDLRFERPALFTVRSPIEVEVLGEDLADIASTAAEVEAILSTMPGLSDVRSSVQPGSPEVILSFNRDLISRYGLDTRRLASTVANLVQGSVATRFSEDEHKVDILVQMDKNELQSLGDLMALPANPTSASSEPLSALADIQVREGPREIRRIGGERAAIISASLDGFDIGHATTQINERIADIEYRSRDLTIEMSGQARDMEGALGQMTMALGLAVFLVYVVMASIFESLLQPLIIMVTVPLAFFGAVAALWLLDIPLSVVVFIGGIILAGIVVNNAIVLIDACNRRRRIDGMPLLEAVSVACELRLRPILMTTLTTVLGLLPLTGWLPWTGGEGTELRAPMAITVVAGLSAATLLTLIVIPTVYVLVERALEQRATRARPD